MQSTTPTTRPTIIILVGLFLASSLLIIGWPPAMLQRSLHAEWENFFVTAEGRLPREFAERFFETSSDLWTTWRRIERKPDVTIIEHDKEGKASRVLDFWIREEFLSAREPDAEVPAIGSHTQGYRISRRMMNLLADYL